MCDLESKIEIAEDHVLKTEALDLYHFHENNLHFIKSYKVFADSNFI